MFYFNFYSFKTKTLYSQYPDALFCNFPNLPITIKYQVQVAPYINPIGRQTKHQILLGNSTERPLSPSGGGEQSR